MKSLEELSLVDDAIHADVILLVFGAVLFFFIFAAHLLGMILNIMAYLRHHLLGKDSPVMRDLFYHKVDKPLPSKLHGRAMLAAIGAWSGSC